MGQKPNKTIERLTGNFFGSPENPGYYISPEELWRDFEAEIRKFSIAEYDFPVRAARLSAAVKRFKTSEMIRFLINVAQWELDDGIEVELTPSLAKKLCKSFFGRTGSQRIMVAVFGNADRKSRNLDNNPERVAALVEKYDGRAQEAWIEALTKIKQVRKRYRDETAN